MNLQISIFGYKIACFGLGNVNYIHKLCKMNTVLLLQSCLEKHTSSPVPHYPVPSILVPQYPGP